MCLQITSETALPIGYPVSPVDPRKILPSDVFDMTCDWDRCSIIEEAASLEDALNTCKSFIRQEVPSYTEDDVQAVAQVVLDVLLDDMVDRHGIPFFATELKKISRNAEFRSRWPMNSDILLLITSRRIWKSCYVSTAYRR